MDQDVFLRGVRAVAVYPKSVDETHALIKGPQAAHFPFFEAVSG
jgi:hypothetical protein